MSNNELKKSLRLDSQAERRLGNLETKNDPVMLGDLAAVAMEELVFHLRKNSGGKKAVGAGLMGSSSRSRQVQRSRNSLKATVEAIAETHQVLHIQHSAEHLVDEEHELVQRRWHWATVPQDLEEVPEVVTAMKGYPLPVHVIAEGSGGEAGGEEAIGEVPRINAVKRKAVDVDAVGAE